MRSIRRLPVVLGAAAAVILATYWEPARAQNALAESGLIGELEGVTIITDPAQWPTSFSEAPALADLVAKGELPPVEERLPKDLMVIQPVDEIGKYGGVWRRGFTGPGDNENGNRIQASDRPILVDHTGATPRPSLVKGWEMSEDGKTYTLFLREGLRWSDGDPFTADDFVFWFEKIYGNPDIVPTPMPDLTPEGKPGRIVKVDDYTVNFEFDVPFYLFEELMMGDTLIGGGQAVRQSDKRTAGGYAPGHYLAQFLPSDEKSIEDLDAEAKAEGFDNWVARLHFKKDWTLNPELPVLGPFRTVQPINNPTWVMERNPYYWAVDTAGNQLPYFDGVVMTIAENLEVLNLRAIAGDYDLQERHVDLGKLPVILENQEAGNYTVHLDLAFNGADAIYQFNQTYDADPEIAKWLTNTDFRRALSLAIDRDQLNETFWLGVATPGSPAPGEVLPYFPGEGWREKWSTYDPEQANQLLDSIGLTEKDSEGYRLRTDNGERLRLEVQAVQAFLPWPKISEMVADQWRQVGIQADVKDTERSLAFTRTQANEHQIMVWNNGGTELLYLFPRHAIPVDPTEAFMGPEFAKWYASNGAQGRAPEDPNMMKILELFRSAAGQKSEERIETAKEIWKILIDQQYGIGTVGQSPALMGVRLVSNKLGNIPSRNCIAQHCRTPGGAHPETWYYKE
ncbi:MAG: ABC transporter substrate-binding protein [Geminicoccaceae bacterium]